MTVVYLWRQNINAPNANHSVSATAGDIVGLGGMPCNRIAGAFVPMYSTRLTEKLPSVSMATNCSCSMVEFHNFPSHLVRCCLLLRSSQVRMAPFSTATANTLGFKGSTAIWSKMSKVHRVKMMNWPANDCARSSSQKPNLANAVWCLEDDAVSLVLITVVPSNMGDEAVD